MNTSEVKLEGLIKSWGDLYRITWEQFITYEMIEGRNWLKYDFSIDVPEDQLMFKDMLQIRMVEELAEAFEAYRQRSSEHFQEEIADSVNFFMAAYHMCGCDLKEMVDPDLLMRPVLTLCSLEETLWEITYKAHILCNLLKNRPWSQSNYLVSLDEFNERLKDLWETFWRGIFKLGVNSYGIFENVERKYLVNRHRLNTGY